MLRFLTCAGTCGVLLLAPHRASAESIAIISGSGSLYWDSSLTSVTLVGADSQFITETHAGANPGFAGGATVDLSTTIPFTNAGNHPLGQVYHGQKFQAWVSGSLRINARPFVAPHQGPSADGTFVTLTTTFTLTGMISGYATSDRTGTPLFATDVSGSGTLSAAYRIVGDSYLQRNAETLAFDSPASPLCWTWTPADIGAVGFAGSSSTCQSAFTVLGSGADIWGNADAFQFLSQPIPADGELVAQLLAPVQNTFTGETSTFAKAGLMLRQTADPGSPHVILDVRPNGGIEFMTRSSLGGPTTFIAGGSTGFPVWLRLARHGGTVTGYTATDGRSWTAIGTTAGPTGDARIGFAVTSHDNTARDGADFAHSGLWRLPSGWSQQDVGTVGRTGQATATNGVFTITGAGADIWGAADQFNAVAQPLGRHATTIARVVSEDNTHMFAKAGVFVGALSPTAARVILDTRPDGNIEFMARLADGGAMSFLGGTTTALPVWLRLVRVDDQFTGSISSDGSSWTTVGSVTDVMEATVPGGLAVTSHDVATLNTSTFDNVAITSDTASTGLRNLLQNPGFEQPAPSGWVSDSFRQTAARFETEEPHSGTMNGACRTTAALDCGLYQDVTAPTDGTYTFSTYANASRDGAWIGINVNGVGIQSLPVRPGAPGVYPAAYTMTFNAKVGDVIRVWLYSSAVPGSAVLDDAQLVY